MRVAELDGLRGIAIILVVLCHAFVVPADLGGVVGVTLFFVLSGYLITRLLLIERDSRGSIDLRSFYGRRALRLFPALVVYLTALASLLAVLGIDMDVWKATWPPAFYLGNYAQILGHDVFPHRQTWSLAVEEHFYLVWPLLVVMGATRRVKLLAGSVAVLIGWRFMVGSFDLLWAYQGTDTNAFALGAGALLAVTRHQGLAPRLPRFTPHTGVLLLIVATFVPVDSPADFLASAVWLSPVVTTISLLIILGVLDHPTPFLRSRILTWSGLISYALYLWHAPLMVLPPWSPIGGRSSRWLDHCLGSGGALLARPRGSHSAKSMEAKSIEVESRSCVHSH